MGVWQFIQDQVLGMKWLNELIGKGLSLLSLDIGERVGGSIQFFLYDTLKITVLLCFLIFVVSYTKVISRRSAVSGYWGGSMALGQTSSLRCWVR